MKIRFKKAIQNLAEEHRIQKGRAILNQTLNGISQIMLQENRITGLLFLTGVTLGSFKMGLAMLIGTGTGIATARLFKLNSENINKGLYGFNAALVGVAGILFLKSTILTWLLIVLGASIATIIQHFFLQQKIQVFTFPFVLATWGILFLVNQNFNYLQSEVGFGPVSSSNYLNIGLKGFGQVIFQDKLISGVLFFIGVAFSAPVAAVFGITASISAAIFSLYLPVPFITIQMGLFSFNAVLCAIVFAGMSLKNVLWTIIAVVISLLISLIMLRHNLPQLTFPFVAASFITLFIKKWAQ